MADDTFDKVGKALGDRMNSALAGFIQDVADIAAGQKDISLLAAGGGVTGFSVDELKSFVGQLGGCDFSLGFLSAKPKVTGSFIRPAVIKASGITDSNGVGALGLEGSISVVGTIKF